MAIEDALQRQQPLVTPSNNVWPTFRGFGSLPMMQFAVLHVLAATAICSGPGTAEGHALLRFSPATCLHELVEHVIYAAHALRDSSMLQESIKEKPAPRNIAIEAARLCGILASIAITIYFTYSPWVMAWTTVFSWIFTLRSLALLLLPSLTSMQVAIPTANTMRIRRQVAVTRALVVYLLACAVIPRSDEEVSWLVVGTSAALFTALAWYDPTGPALDDTSSPVARVALGLCHNLFLTQPFFASTDRSHNVELTIITFGGSWLMVPLTRGTDDVYHAAFVSATAWCFGFVFYGMAPP